MDTLSFTKEQKLELKEQIKTACINILQQRIATIEQAMQSAQEAANSEEKSSAGDKYETGRAMAQLALEMNATQLEEARNDLASINGVNTTVIHQHVTYGAVVVCKDFVFFISMGLGNAMVNGQKVMILSAHAPIATSMHQKKAGETFTFNKKENTILDVF